MTSLLIRHPERWAPERAYAADTLFREFLGLDCSLEVHANDHWSVTLPGHEGELIMPDVLFAGPEVAPESLNASRGLDATSWTPPAALGRFSPMHDELPVLLAEAPVHGSVLDLDARAPLRLGIDVPGVVFAFLTRLEEYSDERDRWGRFPVESSFAHAAGMVARPVVDEYVRLLGGLLRVLWPGLEPRGTGYRIWLTHDIDRANTLPDSMVEVGRRVLGDIALRKSPALATKRLLSRIGSQNRRLSLDPVNTYGDFMDLAEEHGLAATFMWLVGSPDAPVAAKVDSTAVRSSITQICQRGHEIGLHGSLDALERGYDYRTELEELSAVSCTKVQSFRQHYLRCRVPGVWRGLSDAGIELDSSVSWSETWGFRAGTCQEYPVFDAERRTALPLHERPLIVMDQALMSPLNENLSAEEVLQAVQVARRECAFHGGWLTLLWHNTEIQSARQKRLYSQVVRSVV